MKVIVKGIGKDENVDDLKVGNPCMTRSGVIFLVTEIHEHTYSLLDINASIPSIVCIPKGEVIPFYGTINITSSRI